MAAAVGYWMIEMSALATAALAINQIVRIDVVSTAINEAIATTTLIVSDAAVRISVVAVVRTSAALLTISCGPPGARRLEAG